MSTRENPMVVTAVLVLDAPIALDALREILRERLLVHDRFRARIAIPRVPLRRPRWREDAPADMAWHVDQISFGPGALEDDLMAAVSTFMSEPLDLDRPAWRVRLIDGVNGVSTLVVRIHHALADGMSLLGVLAGVSDEGAGFELPTSVPVRRNAFAARDVLKGAAALGDMLRPSPERPPLLEGTLGTRKRLAWSRPIDLERLREAAHASDAHVNDITLTALSGALRRVLQSRRELPSGPVKALVPMALAHESGALENKYVSVFVELPVHVASPAQRLQAVRASVMHARKSGGLSLGRTLVDLLGSLGGYAHRAALSAVSRKGALVASNIAGPPMPLHVGGRAITSMMFSSPSPGEIAMSASVMSYAGALRLVVTCDDRVGPIPATLARYFEEEAEALMAAAEPPRETIAEPA